MGSICIQHGSWNSIGPVFSAEAYVQVSNMKYQTLAPQQDISSRQNLCLRTRNGIFRVCQD